MMTTSREQWFSVNTSVPTESYMNEVCLPAHQNKKGFVSDMDMWDYDCFVVVFNS